MGYMGMTRKQNATSTTTGTMTFQLETPGFFSDAGRTAVYVGDTPYKSWHITLSGTDKVDIEGNNGDPDSSGDWFTLTSASTAQVHESTSALQFFRMKVTSISGSITANFFGSEA